MPARDGVTIFHNPKCSTSNHAMAVADELGVQPDVVLYLKNPPDAATLRSIIAKLEDPVTDLVRRDNTWAKLGLTDDDAATEDQVVDLLGRHPELMQRPVLVKGDRAIIGRPKDRVRDLLA
jgi:arsenate reductase